MVFRSILIVIVLYSNIYSYECSNITELAGQDPKIIGGWPADKHSTKYQVSIQFGQSHICGGALISLTKVLTAAHCLYNIYATPPYIHPARVFRLVMGTTELQPVDPDALIFRVRKYVKHPEFNLENLQNDIAIMLPQGSFPEFHPQVAPIPMVSIRMEPKTTCSINGWGSTEQDGFSVNKLRTTEIEIMKPDLCKSVYTMRKGMICAGRWKGGRDSCQGDSGGPLTCMNVLVGIVSWGDGCGKKGKPGVYTDVLYYKQWIEENASTRASIFHPIIFILFLIFSFCLS